MKNQSRGHAKKVECSSTSMACPRAFRRTKIAQVRQLQRKLSNVRSARAGKATAMENCLKRLRDRKRENTFVPLLLINIVVKFGTNRIKRSVVNSFLSRRLGNFAFSSNDDLRFDKVCTLSVIFSAPNVNPLVTSCG